jgi:hypothetical protein
MSLQSRTRWRVSLVGALTVATGMSLCALPAAHATPDGHWTTLSKGDVRTVQQPSVHRFGHDVQVVWTQPQGQKYALWTQILKPNGNPSGRPTRILVWEALIPDPVIFGIGSERVIAFSGLRTGDITDPYTNGAEYYLTSHDGRSWTLGHGSLSASTSAFGSYGTAAIDYNGSPLVAFTEASSSRISFHHGIDSHSPATSADGHTADTGNFAYNTGLGQDASTADVWAVWYSNSGKPATNGVDAQRLFPSMGSLVQGPASSKSRGGSATSTAPDQDLPAVSRPAKAGGGVYTAYATPKDNAVVVWRIGASRPAFTIKAVATVGQVSLSSGPKGRLWVYWRDGSGHLRATRSNAAATRAGAIRSIAPPRGTTAYRTAGDGSHGSLNLVSLFAGGRGRMESALVLPGLTGSAARSWHQGHRYKVKVTDAGAAVKGAVVHFGGHKARTNRRGIARLHVANGASLGRSVVSINHHGYAGARLKVKVKR